MPNDQTWIPVRINVAKKSHPSVSEPVSARLEELIRGQLNERQLSKIELTNIAGELITSLVTTPPETEEKK